jgi:glycerol-3-phosphate acyltransferase PlsY
MIQQIAGLIVSYLLGSLPTAFILGRQARGIDLRQHGSGNLGATNAFRVLGPYIGTSVLLVDIAKGTLAVLLANRVFGPHGPIAANLYLCLSAVAVVSGHNWTIFMKFKGGKGMATSLGVLIAFSMIIENFFLVMLAIIVLWLAIFLASGIVSLASVIASALMPFIAISFHLPRTILIFTTILCAFSLIRHKSNIRRLLQKKEHRFDTRRIFKKFSK